MADYDSDRGSSSSDQTSSGAVQRSAGKRTLSEQRYSGVVQHNGGNAGADPNAVHAAADQGISGAGERLPFMDQIVRSFGSHDVSNVQAHTDANAATASREMGATAYAKGDHVAFGGTPDLHTAAHEAAHVVQQRGGVQLKGGVGEAGDSYEQHADAVADKVVKGESAEGLLDTMAGGAGGASGVQSQAVQKLGVPLDQDLPADQSKPAHGEIKGEQRKWSVDQYVEMWEKEQGHKIKKEEREAIDYGCIGLTANNLKGMPANPLDHAEKIYGDFERAHEFMVTQNKMLDWMASIPIAGAAVPKARYVMFGKLFWSNQSPKWEDRLKPNKKAFKPDKKTGEVDMTGYNYEAQSKWDVDEDGNRVKSGYVNFDYGFWDDASKCFWHANHYMDYTNPDDPMIVYQSTKGHFIQGYRDFDRLVFGVAKAENYDPGLAAINHATSGSSSGAGR
jgi:hypothetical protein